MSERRPPEELDPRKCNAWNPKRLKHCGSWAGAGTDHKGIGPCSKHGGSTKAHVVAAEREQARRACVALGVPIETTGVEALLDELARSKGNVAFYELLVQELPTHPEPDVHHPGEDGGHWVRGAPGIYGPTYHQSGIPTGEAKPHVLLALYNDERKHYATVASMVVKANVDERRVELAETAAQRDGAEIAARFRTLIRALGRSLDDPEVQAAARLALSGPPTLEGQETAA